MPSFRGNDATRILAKGARPEARSPPLVSRYVVADRFKSAPHPPSPLECNIDGRRFAAVPIGAWRDAKRLGPPAGSPEGLLRFGGHTYLLTGHVQPTEPQTARLLETLTARELQIAYRIGDGASDKNIAYDLGISEYTVREHVRRVFHKLRVSKRASIVKVLYRGC